ncbi:uncharacterized protein LOC128553139 [Mercenaria mercenaria]|uniref:uncharacterized protein LOC128553139 n=1 Tax=Mercenaria mercenaria TaxID=6596 RepID=UPI00234F4E8B|nr:uncharacterized protein LOC128553139 [Mercenaria mercenaria]
MKIDKLRSIREGQRKVIEIQLQKIENAKDSSSMSEFRAILESVTGKFENLVSLNEKILEQTEIGEIEEEIINSEEYSSAIQIKLREFQEFSESREKSSQNQSQRNNSSTPGEQQTIIVQDRNSASSTQYSRLPKFSLPTFNGNILEWQAFWDSFSSAVHSNQNLTDVQKFNYLRSQLKDEAARKIDGFALTNANYSNAVELLHEQYGQKHKIVHAYIQSLLHLPSPSNTLPSLRGYYDKLETYIRGLESLDQHEDSFGTFSVPVIFDKLPAEIRKNLAREHKGRNLELHEMRRAIYVEINVLEAGQVNSNVYLHETPATVSLLTGSGFRPRARQDSDKNHVRPHPHPRTQQQQQQRFTNAKICIFCSSNTHFANDCNVMRDYESRIAVVKNKRLCFNCLGTHQVSNCKSQKRCRNCQKRHHTSICQNLSQVQPPIQTSSASAVSDNQLQHQTAALHTYDHITFEQTTCEQQTPHVLLKTAISPVTCGIISADTNILFDEGSQRSFITREHADKLRLTFTGTDTLHLASFGNSKNEVRHLDTATVFLITSTKEKIPINVLIVPTVAVPFQKYNKNVSHLQHLKGLKLAHPLIEDTTFEVQLLIGADYYWRIVEDKIIRGPGPTAVASKAGYLLSGPVPFHASSSRATTSLTLNVITQSPKDIDLQKFLKLESLGIQQSEDEIPERSYMTEYQDTSITFTGDKYVAKLPMKLDHPALPTNYGIVKRRTETLVSRLRQDPVTLKHYGDIIRDQESRGFIEEVPDTEQPHNSVHYIPHHAVKKESSTTPVRIVYD